RVRVIKTLKGELFVKHSDLYYEVVKVANYSKASHTVPISYPWKTQSYDYMMKQKEMKNE
ncbi:MAG: hypothetical protein LBI63_01895, partial [Candidatus Ancillula sp.]|nr:hypothetical protein [Candidatus Ancillula sp.]